MSALLLLVILAFIVRQLAVGWGAVQTYPWRWNWWILISSFVVMQAAYMIMARAWRSVLRAIGVRLDYRTAYGVFYVSNLGRYVPGKLWQIGAAAIMGRRLGLSGTDMAASMIVHLLYFLPVGTTLALLAGGFPPPYNRPEVQIGVWVLALLAMAVAVWPHILLRAFPFLARWFGIDPARWNLAPRRRVGIALQTLAAWIFLSAGFALFVISVTPLPAQDGVALARVYIASHILGYVALIAPGGIGVREGVLAVLLQPLMGAGPAAGLALLTRLWSTLTEVVAVIPAIAWTRRSMQVLEPAGDRTEKPPGGGRTGR